MNKRIKKKHYKKWIDEEFSHCLECGKKLDRKKNEYHRKFGACDSTCYLHSVGMNWSDFY